MTPSEQRLKLAETHMAAAQSLTTKGTIMGVIAAILTVLSAFGVHLNNTVILSAAGLIVSAVLLLWQAARHHTLLALKLVEGGVSAASGASPALGGDEHDAR